jgi:hypothetical protein
VVRNKQTKNFLLSAIPSKMSTLKCESTLKVKDERKCGSTLEVKDELKLSTLELNLFTFLSDRRWYSYSSKGICSYLKISQVQLRKVAMTLQKKVKDNINFFTFKNVEYVGWESRRLDYERDKINGTNKIEKLIAKGYYDTIQ